MRGHRPGAGGPVAEVGKHEAHGAGVTAVDFPGGAAWPVTTWQGCPRPSVDSMGWALRHDEESAAAFRWPRTGTRRSSPPRTPSTSPGTPMRICSSATAPGSASARSSPAWHSRRPSGRCSRDSPRSGVLRPRVCDATCPPSRPGRQQAARQRHSTYLPHTSECSGPAWPPSGPAYPPDAPTRHAHPQTA